MVESYYNVTAHGTGFEGFINYANLLVDGWMSILFIAFVYLATMFAGSKSEWSRSGVSAFGFLLCLISSMILSLFTVVNPIVTFVCIFGLGASIFLMTIEGR